MPAGSGREILSPGEEAFMGEGGFRAIGFDSRRRDVAEGQGEEKEWMVNGAERYVHSHSSLLPDVPAKGSRR